ncbi:MAG: alpha-glucan family phosphorylase [Microgenomates group bacterium]
MNSGTMVTVITLPDSPQNAMPTPFLSQQNPIAYFCAEFGFDSSIPIYAGGLGILAGDTIKQAASSNIPFIGIGLLYRGYGAIQNISEDGLQTEADWLFDPLSAGLEHVYVDNDPLFIKIHLTEVEVWVRVWKKSFDNNVVLYLLDTETDQNQLSERSITQILYSGTNEQQLKQQLILGIGGIKLLKELQIRPILYHVNEGRPSFLHWQLIRSAMDTHGMNYESARALAIEKTVYTNHTLVAAGNQGYSMDLLRVFARYYADKMGISTEQLLADGIDTNPDVFSITNYALNTSRRANGVSELHTRLSQGTWSRYTWVNVTNGVHLPTWQDHEITQKNDSRSLWAHHQHLKENLARFVQEKTGYTYDPKRLVISWARRIAGYKQLPLLFSDIKRLSKLIKNENMPIQLLVSGKAHIGDTSGKYELQNIIKLFQTELAGHALFIPNYSIEVSQQLTRGSDVWLNTPEYGREACGTSGMKAISNGVLQCTVADGWAAEVDWSDIGWVLNHEKLAESIYSTLEEKIVPQFYANKPEEFSPVWVDKMQKSIELSSKFSTKRMLDEYLSKLYQVQQG